MKRALLALALCGCATPPALPPETPCIINAIGALPTDYHDVSVRNVENLVKAIEGCRLIQRDAGL